MKQKTVVWTALVVAIAALFTGCGNRAAPEEFQKVMEEKSGNELFNELLALDQKYPDAFAVKAQLGQMLFASGDYSKATSYLKRAEKLIGQAENDTAKVNLYMRLSVLDFEKKQYESALLYAEKALTLDPKGEYGTVFLKARCLLMLKQETEAFLLYDQNWPLHEHMSRLDFNVYFDHCRETGSSMRALEVLDAYQAQFEYVAGQGLQASQLYEELGMIEESILSAAMELEYLHSSGAVTRAQLRERMTAIGEKLDDPAFNPKKLGKGIVQGLLHYFNEEWEKADAVLQKEKSTHHFLSYVKMAAEFERQGATIRQLQEYVELEKYFRDLAGYYYHFWRGMKIGEGEYNFNVARNVLEKCIILARDTEYARETRREIGRMLGLESAAGEKLLLTKELDWFLSRLQSGEEPAVLEPVLDMLSVPDNIYTMSGIVFLRDLSHGFPAVKAYLEKRKKQSEGRLHERLVMITEG